MRNRLFSPLWFPLMVLGTGIQLLGTLVWNIGAWLHDLTLDLP